VFEEDYKTWLSDGGWEVEYYMGSPRQPEGGKGGAPQWPKRGTKTISDMGKHVIWDDEKGWVSDTDCEVKEKAKGE